MKTYVLNPGNDLSALQLTERPRPEPGPREVLLRLRAVSLNYRDVAILRGTYGAFSRPLVPVSDGVGEVVAVGSDVQRFRVGDRMIPSYVPDWIRGPPREDTARRRLGGPLDGLLREYACVHEDAGIAAPPHLSDAEAATLPIAGVTAWHALFTQAHVGPGDTVVAQGTGGVSLFVVQLARMAGARVLVTSRSEAKLGRALALGAAEGIHTGTHPDWATRVRELTGGRGADHVVDVAGGDGVARSVEAVRMGGTVTLVGFLESATVRFDIRPALSRVVRLQAVSTGSRDDLEALARALTVHGVHPVVDRVFPFAQAPDAFAFLESGAQFGKVVITFP
ncbi:zinc-dependent alcohol dehydrogenase family protein [Corallococcus carmarthensis]|uniref:NAD(P)-dependent alcohol dehydrogenase n=1 Tax=Corallococcus carmarthensis TaxID=2316728 RepID=A0A3A8K583_9BACT|nr:NAD(P)-dependent alcohol dehydrogenase [Corallococcus carmarthensis]NOK17361.1 NAD(P)-dependent alcohol dehydrogenase [Corallococcus carmarthensis]RKH03210.1 NAD(P)-dependent alcohol dehydrogenase [Corallococcus carmarthensis]